MPNVGNKVFNLSFCLSTTEEDEGQLLPQTTHTQEQERAAGCAGPQPGECRGHQRSCCCRWFCDRVVISVCRRTAGSPWCSPLTTRPGRAAIWRRASTSCAAPPGSPLVRSRVRAHPAALSRTPPPELLLLLLQGVWAEPAAPRHPWWWPKEQAAAPNLQDWRRALARWTRTHRSCVCTTVFSTRTHTHTQAFTLPLDAANGWTCFQKSVAVKEEPWSPGLISRSINNLSGLWCPSSGCVWFYGLTWFWVNWRRLVAALGTGRPSALLL